MDYRTKALLLFGLGLLLVLNPVYLFPGGVPGEKTYTYRAERIETYTDFAHATHPRAALDCSDGITNRECVLERQVGYDGTLRVENSTTVQLEDDERGLFSEYDYVRFDEGYTRPNATAENGTLVLSTEPKPWSQVLGEYAVSFDDLPPLGKQAIRTGNASTTYWKRLGEDVDPVVPDYQRLVEQNGTFYAINRYPGDWWKPIPEWLSTLLRFVGVSGGAALAFVGASRHARIVDKRDHDDRGPG